MIECCKENIWYVKKRKRKRKKVFAFIVWLTIFVCVFSYYKFIISNQVIQICYEKISAISTDAINKSILLSLDNSLSYSELITIEKNSQGDITLMSANSYKINYIAAEITKNVKNQIEAKLSQGVEIPILAFSGVRLLSGYGFNVNFQSISIASVSCDFISKFESVGINQTMHAIYANINSNVSIAMPFSKKVKQCNGLVLISQAVIVGKVPEVYLNGGLFC